MRLFLLLALAGAPTAARAQCESTRIGVIEKSCKAELQISADGRRKSSATCLESLRAIWTDCANDPKLNKKGEAFPPQPTNQPNPARSVWDLFDAFGFKSERPPERPAGSGAKKDPAEAESKHPESRHERGARPQDLELLKTLEDTSDKLGDTRGLNEATAGYLGSNKPADADRAASKAIAADPENAQAYSLRAMARLSQGRFEEAAADARQALKRNPRDEAALQTKAYADSKLRPIRLDQRLLRSVFTTDGGVAGPGGEAAAGRLDGARGPRAVADPGPAADSAPSGAAPGPSATKAAADAPGRRQVEALLQTALSYLEMKDFQRALINATRAIARDPGNAEAWRIRARISNRLKNYKAALADANQALRLDPADVEALLERAYAELNLGLLAEALADADSALALAPRNALGRLYRAMILEKLGRRDEAAEDYRSAARLDPSLKPIADAALARLLGAPRPPPAPPRPRRPLLPLASAVAGVLVLLGLARALRRETTAFPARAETPPGAGGGILAPGTVLARNFRIDRELARGGIGVVYQATDLTLRRKVAVKQLQREALESPSVREKFLLEARLAANLSHPNLAQILSVVADGDLYLVFELIDGEALDAILARRGALDAAQARAVVSGVCAAMEYAHAKRVIHRDLKPANVMITVSGACKVLDFGIAHLARTASAATRTEAWGTPPYMAPEQELGEVSARSDLYAVGVLAYELLTGSRPFRGAGLRARKLARDFIPATRAVPGLPAAVDGFFAKALDPEPAGRFASAAELAEAFATALGTPPRGSAAGGAAVTPGSAA